MRRQQPIAHLLYNYLFPNPTTNDPPSFASHLARNLVPEVRIEVATFYGDLNSTEARYPGLNYCHAPHRLRLGRFKHHRRLFEAFDTLNLTYGEIQDFCCWEGTKWARERYEKDEGIKVLDTTGDDIASFVDRRVRNYGDDRRRHSITRKTDISVVVEPATSTVASSLSTSQSLDEDMHDADAESDAHDLIATSADTARDANRMRSQGGNVPEFTPARETHMAPLQHRHDHIIHQRIMAAYERGHMPLPEFEQYIKEQRERGMLPYISSPREQTILQSSMSAISAGNASTGPTPIAIDRMSA